MGTPERIVIESMFKVVDKEGLDVDFKLNSAQARIDDLWWQRMIIPKARQEGVSTYFLAKNTVKCLGKRNTRAVIISHDSESTERMLLKVKYFLENIKGPAPVIKNNSKSEITFPKTNSMLYIGTAGSVAFGRGDTITDLHCSELAYWPNSKKLLSGLLAAVPKRTGCVSIESTGNGAGNDYHSRCMKAAKGQSTYRLVFLPWWDFPEYTLGNINAEAANEILSNPSEAYGEVWEDDKGKVHYLREKYNLTAAQLGWRRMIIEDECDGDLYLWNKDYPSDLDDCFQIAGGGIFQYVNFVKSPDWIKVDQNFHLLRSHPHKKLHYVIGGDVAAGVRRDSSVAEIFCLETEEQVGEWVSNAIEPDIFAHKLSELGYLFNEAYIGVESNNHGILTLKELSSHDYKTGRLRYSLHKIYRTPGKVRNTKGDEVKRVVDLGVRTTSASKPYIIGKLRKKLKGSAIIHSEVLKNELSTFVEHENGEMGAAENCHDDCVMAAGMAFFVQDKAGIALLDSPIRPDEVPDPKKDPFSLESIIDEMTKGRGDGSKQTFPSYLTLVN